MNTARMHMGEMLSLIGLRMKIEKRRETNGIPEGVPDSLLLRVMERKPNNMEEFLALEEGRKEFWHYYGDLILKTVEKGCLQANSFVPWSKEENEKLLTMVKDKSVREIAVELKRTEGAIRRRLQKLEQESLRQKGNGHV